MKRNFIEALANRRSYYHLSDRSPVSDEDIIHAVREVARYVPSAYNSRSTRMVLLLGDEHRRLWNVVKDKLAHVLPVTVYERAEAKINSQFFCAHGTLLFFEDASVVRRMQAEEPLYREMFPTWAQHTNAMHQLAAWVALSELGLGASLQHYNPLIDAEVRHAWSLPADWQLVAQLPFGLPTASPEPRAAAEDVSKRVLVMG